MQGPRLHLHQQEQLYPKTAKWNLLFQAKSHIAAKKLQQYKLGRKCRKRARPSFIQMHVTVQSHLPQTRSPTAGCRLEGPKEQPGLLSLSFG